MRAVSAALLALGLLGVWGSASSVGPAESQTAQIRRGAPAVVATAAAAAPETMTAATFPAGGDGFVAGVQGGHGFVDATVDGGATWHRLASLRGVAFTDLLVSRDGQGWAAARPIRGTNPQPWSRTLYATVDGRRRWTEAGRVPGRITELTMMGRTPWISVAGACRDTSCSGAVLTVSGGHLRRLWTAPGPVLSLTVHGTTAWAAVWLSSPTKRSLLTVYRSGNGGRSWSPEGLIDRSELAISPYAGLGLESQLIFVSRRVGYASAFALSMCAMINCTVTTVERTTNGGRTWEPIRAVRIPCQYAPEMAATGSNVAVVQQVSLAACAGPEARLFVSRDRGNRFLHPFRWPDTSIVSLGILPHDRFWSLSPSGLLMSGHGGTTWHQVFPNVFPTGAADLVTPRVGYAAGDQTNPAALLKTVDGGATWSVVAKRAQRP